MLRRTLKRALYHASSNSDGHGWVLSGHLKNQAFFNFIDHFGIGYDYNGVDSVDEISEKVAAMAKKKRTCCREDKARDVGH